MLENPYQSEDRVSGAVFGSAAASFAARIALLAVVAELVFLGGGAISPEPRDHPSWLLPLLGNPAFGAVWVVLACLCLPALYVAGMICFGPGWLAWIIVTCALQAVFYFSGSWIAAYVFYQVRYWFLRRFPT